MFEAATSGFMLAAIDGAAPICSTSYHAKVLLIAVQELHLLPLKFTLLRLSGDVTPSMLHHKSLTKTCHEHHVYVLMHIIKCVDQFM